MKIARRIFNLRFFSNVLFSKNKISKILLYVHHILTNPILIFPQDYPNHVLPESMYIEVLPIPHEHARVWQFMLRF